MFVYTALDAGGRRLSESIEAANLSEAQRHLMRKGLRVLSVEPSRGRSRSGAETHARVRAGARTKELALFSRQMAMMLNAGAPVVQAIHTMREQTGRPAWLALLADLCEQVEGGSTLRDAMARHPRAFPGAFSSVIRAGESTGTLVDSFQRLAALLETRVRVKRRVISALVYPAVLLLLAVSVVCTMTLFVLPRFADLFAMLDTPLPWITRLMLDTSAWVKQWWLVLLGGIVAFVAPLVIWVYTEAGRRTLGRWVLTLPVVGRAASGVILGQLLQVWSVLLRSHVALLESINQGRAVTRNAAFLDLIDKVERTLSEGRALSSVLKQSRLVPPPVVSAIATGENSGRLGESMAFAATWIEEENDALIGALTRALEPMILIGMGVVVGLVAVSLFLPLFDIATAA